MWRLSLHTSASLRTSLPLRNAVRPVQQCLPSTSAGASLTSSPVFHVTGKNYSTGAVDRPAAQELTQWQAIRRSHAASTEGGAVQAQKELGDSKMSLVIFDKDGTLICFHSMWKPWALSTASRLEMKSGLQSVGLADKVFRLLGYNVATERVEPGLLAEATMPQVKLKLIDLLVEHDVDRHSATEIVNHVWEDCDTSETLSALTDLRELFQTLRDHDVKIAVCTADLRSNTLPTLEKLGIAEFVDVIVCGDDADGKPKPDPHNALRICSMLGVDPKKALMVGDTMADIGMGKSAELGKTVGVLSGVANRRQLQPHADMILSHVGHLLPVVLGEVAEGAKRVLGMHTSLFIADKTGRVLRFEGMESPWSLGSAKGFMVHQGLSRSQLSSCLNDFLNSPPPSVDPSAPAKEITGLDVRSVLIRMLSAKMDRIRAENLVESVWTNEGGADLVVLRDLEEIFDRLEEAGIAILLLVEGSRADAMPALEKVGLLDIVDMVMYVDDTQDKRAEEVAKVRHRLELSDACANLPMVEVEIPKPDPSSMTPLSEFERKIQEREKTTVLSAAGGGGLLQNGPGVVTQKRAFHTGVAGRSRAISSGPRNEVTGLREGQTPTHIIVGAGSAGCVLANRISANPNHQVLVLEAGPKDEWWNWKIHMPAALMYNLMNDKYNWYYHTQPLKELNNRVMYWPRGRVWGGSSSLNAMCYVRGHAFDYDRWGKEGAEGWSYATCLPYFKKAQTHEYGPDLYRGGSGPLKVTAGKLDSHPLYGAFVKAGVQAGFGHTTDPNGYRQEGFGHMDLTVWEGKRMSASRAYLKPALDRDNLSVLSNALTRRILFNGKRAVGVEVELGGYKQKIYTDHDVILCGGAINTPQLLMLSGVGPGAELKKHDIHIVQDTPGVGANLQDHLEIYVQQKCSKPVTLYNQMTWKYPHNMIKTGLQWFLTQRGLGASSHLEAGAFTRSREELPHPDLQYHFLPASVHDHGRQPGGCHAYQVHVGPERPESRGTVTLASKDPHAHALMQPNYLATEQDWIDFRAGVRQARHIFAQQAFDEFRDVELAPGPEAQSDEQIDEFIRRAAETAYHPSCTARMGASTNSMAVVEPTSMKVHGLDGLRVVDASVMPSIVTGNLNAPTIMLAERAADLLQGHRMLDPLHVPVWRPGDPFELPMDKPQAAQQI